MGSCVDYFGYFYYGSCSCYCSILARYVKRGLGTFYKFNEIWKDLGCYKIKEVQSGLLESY